MNYPSKQYQCSKCGSVAVEHFRVVGNFLDYPMIGVRCLNCRHEYTRSEFRTESVGTSYTGNELPEKF